MPASFTQGYPGLHCAEIYSITDHCAVVGKKILILKFLDPFGGNPMWQGRSCRNGELQKRDS
jgi:hypothetical protein